MASPATVSILIPTYRQVGFIEEAIRSALAQTYRPLEIIVSDDGSDDGTAYIARQVAAKADGLVRVLSSTENQGLAGNFNRALEAASGDLIAWLGGDDVMYPDKIARQVEVLERHPEAAGCCHDAEVFDSDTGRIFGRFSEIYNGRSGFREGGVELFFDPGYMMWPSSFLIRSSARPLEGYDTRLRLASEWVFDIETFRTGRVVPINDVLGRYRRHSSNITSDATLLEGALEEGFMAMAIIAARWPELTGLARQRRTGLLMGRVLAAVQARDWGIARQYGRAALAEGGAMRVGRIVVSYGRGMLGRRLAGLRVPA